MTTITLHNPWTHAIVERDITGLTQSQLDAYVTTRNGVQLRERTKTGPRGGAVRIYQAAEACPDWGYWYDSKTDAAKRSNSSDRIAL